MVTNVKHGVNVGPVSPSLDLKPGDLVAWHGEALPVLHIELVQPHQSDGGVLMAAVPWAHLTDPAGRYVVDLANGKWAYGFQVMRPSEEEISRYELEMEAAESAAWFESLRLSGPDVDRLAEVLGEGRVRTTFMARRHAASLAKDPAGESAHFHDLPIALTADNS